ncbi:MAG TPA: diacylglycerol kinase family protein, partial [Phototrophicaceae bacterium]|nr:diacylglycerol kinase family protein [Phototrophicaceae bacterium]
MSANDPANPNLIQTEPTVNADRREAQPAEQEAPSLKFKRVHIIVNPASGQEGLRLPGLNKILNDLGIEWEMFVLRRGGEAGERAQQAIAAGVDAVVVYGGDGT